MEYTLNNRKYLKEASFYSTVSSMLIKRDSLNSDLLLIIFYLYPFKKQSLYQIKAVGEIRNGGGWLDSNLTVFSLEGVPKENTILMITQHLKKMQLTSLVFLVCLFSSPKTDTHKNVSSLAVYSE